MEIIIATGNAGKVREFKRMLEPLGYLRQGLSGNRLTRRLSPTIPASAWTR